MTDDGRSSGATNAEPLDPYRELFERSADAILIIDGDRFVDCNQATVEMLRARDREHILRTHPSVLSPEFQPDGRDSFSKANEMIATAFEKGSNRFEWDHMRSDGEVFPVEVLLTAVPREGRTILHVVWRDITERRELEARFRLAQKMEAVGRMAGGIAHDFNNLLVAIIGNADIVAESLKDSPEEAQCVEEILGAGRRAAALVRQLMAFSRNEEVQFTVINVSDVVRDIENILGRLLDERYALDLRLSVEPLRVLADLGQLEQVVINLVTNARDAMPDGGPVSVEVRRIEASDGAVGVGVELRPGAYAAISVSDSGHGMSPDVAQRAFDPFFTTKGVGKGTGLGLATVYAIAERGGGGVSLQTDVGRGTTVRVYLPITAAEIKSRTAEPMGASEVSGTESVLVVEDEPAVSGLVVRALTSAGYRVTLAQDGVEALELFEESTEPVDLVLTDVVMPRMGGVELVRRLRAARFEGAVMLTSGYTNNEVESATDLGGELDLLAKPYTTTELLTRIRAALDRGAKRPLAR